MAHFRLADGWRGGAAAEGVAVDAVSAFAWWAWGNRLTASAGRAKPNVGYRGYIPRRAEVPVTPGPSQ